MQLHLHKLFELLSARFILDSRDKPIMDDKEDEVGFIQEDAELNLEFWLLFDWFYDYKNKCEQIFINLILIEKVKKKSKPQKVMSHSK